MNLQEPNDEAQNYYGLFGLAAHQRTAKRYRDIQFPLKSINYDVSITEGIASITQTQVYHSTSNQFMEAQFRFPISPAVCLHKFIATFADKMIIGRVEEKDYASQKYQEAVREGRRAVYAQISEESRGIMTIRIGNLDPGTDVSIQIGYLQQLKLEINTFYSFSLQTRLTPRFLNRLPNQDFLNSFRNKFITLYGQFQWDFKISVKSSRKIVSFKSPTHQLKLQSRNDEFTSLSFTLENGSLKNNFIFLYTTENFELPSFTMGRTDASTTVMVSFIPKFCTLSLGDAEKAELSGNKFEVDMDSVMAEYNFLLDRSGSMSGQKIQSAKQALILFLKSLPSNSYFNVISFGSMSVKLFPTSVKNKDYNMKTALKQINKMGADMGGTEILRPLEDLFSSPVIQGFPKQIFLLTDGEVSNTESVVELVRQNAKYSRVHAIGVGKGVSKNLIVECAKSGKGCHFFIQQSQDPAPKIIQLLQDSMSAIITKVDLSFDKQLVSSIVPNPNKLPFILKGDIANFFITFKEHLKENTKIKLSYSDSLNNLPYSSEVTISQNSLNVPFIDKMGNFRVIKALQMSSIEEKNLEENIYYAKQIDPRKQVVSLSIKHQILSKFTAFLCDQMILVDGRYESITSRGRAFVNIREQIAGKLIQEYQGYRGISVRGRGRVCMKSSRTLVKAKTCRRKSSSSAQLKRRDRSRSRSRSMEHKKQKKNDIKQQKRSLSKQPTQKELKATSQLNKIINQQSSQGFWNNQQLLKGIVDEEIRKKLPKGKQQAVAITLLILKWLSQQNIPQQYTLIIKKAVSWLRKQPFFTQCTLLYSYIPS